jgi:aerobic-type carbon monoxide dehydrogenase small subunit (CoxS/CutS family)
MTYPLNVTVNGHAQNLDVDAHRSLLSVLRTEMGLTGTKEGCDDSECGACMVLLDDRPVNSCSYLALQADQRTVTTIEGISTGTDLHPVQEALLDQAGVQCGFCTPGMVISTIALLKSQPACTEDDVRLALGGNLCRCTGYQKIVRAVMSVAERSVSDDQAQEHSA